MIKVEIKGMKALQASLAGMQKQVNFAASKALNRIAKNISDAMPQEIENAIDRPTPFTKRGVGVLKYAKRDDRIAIVGFRRKQAEYMQWQVEGGTYNPGSKGLRLPSAIKLNQYGNIPKGIIAQLISVARKERGLKKASSKRIRVSANVELFYGDPKDQKGKAWPRGIYKAVNNALIPLIVFPVTQAKYKVKFDFYGKAERIANKEWRKAFDEELDNALRTAR